jgi:hypothetical protein
MKKKELRTEQLNLRLTVTERRALDKLAEKESRTPADTVRALIKRATVSLLTLAVFGCGGAPFSAVDGTLPADGGQKADAHSEGGADANEIGSDAGESGYDAADADAGGMSVDADADAGSKEASVACCEAPTEACSTALSSCPIPSENHGSFPTSFEVYTTPAENCMTVTTPSACLCDYTCACVEAAYQCAHGTVSCANDPVQGLLITCTD